MNRLRSCRTRVSSFFFVLAVNGETGEAAAKPVTDLIRPEPKPLYGLELLDAGGEAETFTYTANGKVATVKDGANNLTTYEYDGFDRPLRVFMPNLTKGAGTSSTTDFEQVTLDNNGNVSSHRLRDGQVIGFTYDRLNRGTFKNLPNEPDVTYTYDNLGWVKSAKSQSSGTKAPASPIAGSCLPTSAEASLRCPARMRRCSRSIPMTNMASRRPRPPTRSLQPPLRRGLAPASRAGGAAARGS